LPLQVALGERPHRAEAGVVDQHVHRAVGREAPVDASDPLGPRKVRDQDLDPDTMPPV
jgi:hypothetical protein